MIKGTQRIAPAWRIVAAKGGRIIRARAYAVSSGRTAAARRRCWLARKGGAPTLLGYSEDGRHANQDTVIHEVEPIRVMGEEGIDHDPGGSEVWDHMQDLDEKYELDGDPHAVTLRLTKGTTGKSAMGRAHFKTAGLQRLINAVFLRVTDAHDRLMEKAPGGSCAYEESAVQEWRKMAGEAREAARAMPLPEVESAVPNGGARMLLTNLRDAARQASGLAKQQAARLIGRGKFGAIVD